MKEMKNLYSERDLSEKLKNINAVLTADKSSVVDRYAGIAELGLFKNELKIGVLTLGLFDENAQVRQLSSNILDQSYRLGQTSSLVVNIWQDTTKNFDQYQDNLHQLLRQISEILKNHRKHSIKDVVVTDYGRRHSLIILQKIGAFMSRRFSDTDRGPDYINPLTEILREDYREIITRVHQALESNDIYCRRRSLLTIGELGLANNMQTAFDTIVEAVDSDQNRNNYLVTRDGIKALTSLVTNNPSLYEIYVDVLHNYYFQRTYDVPDRDQKTKHSYYTRQDCITAVASVDQVEEIDAFPTLTEFLAQGKKQGFLNMMNRNDGGYASVATKEVVIKHLKNMYQADQSKSPDQLTDRQRAIMNYVTDWIGSSITNVRKTSIQFFANLPNKTEAYKYLSHSIEKNSKEIDKLWQEIEIQVSKNQDMTKRQADKFKQFISDRQFLVISISQLMNSQIAQVSFDIHQLSSFFTTLESWLKQDFSSVSRVSNISKNCRLEILWRIYELIHNLKVYTPDFEFDIAKIDIIERMLSTESTADYHAVLQLFAARMQDAPTRYLRRLSETDSPGLVKICAELDFYVHHYYYHADNNSDVKLEDISDYLLNNFSKYLKATETRIHDNLINMFLPIIGKIEGYKARELTNRILVDDTIPVMRRVKIAQELQGYQSYHLRDIILRLLITNMKIRHKRADLVRNLIVTLHYSSNYVQQQGWDLNNLSPFQDDTSSRVVSYLEKWLSTYQALDLPVLFEEDANSPILQLNRLKENSVVSTMFAELHDSTAKVYTSYKHFPSALIFLNNGFSDAEMAQQVQDKLKSRSSDTDAKNRSSETPTIIGRVIDINEIEVTIDIGLLQIYPTLSWQAFHGGQKPTSTAQEDNLRDQYLYKTLIFSIQECDFIQFGNDLFIESIALSRHISSIEDTSTKSIFGTLVQVNTNIEEPGLVFSSQTSEVFVPKHELSWNVSKEWLSKGWIEHFEARSGQLFEIRSLDDYWSLRQNNSNSFNFYHRLATNSQQDFEIIFIKQDAIGYSFELEAGLNCYIPPERLLRKTDTEYQFLLPDDDISLGDRLPVRFITRDVFGQPELFLSHVDGSIKQSAYREEFNLGKRIEGILENLNEQQKAGDLKVDSEILSDFTIQIAELPVDSKDIEITNGETLSGIIQEIDEYNKQIKLVYSPMLPDELQSEKWYPCKVEYIKDNNADWMLIKHANIVGRLSEYNMTYGHEKVIDTVQRGDLLYARKANKDVDWERVGSSTVNLRKNLRIQLGLHSDKPTTLNILSTNRKVIRLLNANNEVIKLDTSNLSGISEKIQSKLRAGNRLKFTLKKQNNNVELTLQEPRIQFTLLKNLKPPHPQTHRKINDIINVGQEIKCIYVSSHSNYELFEYQLGQILAVDKRSIANDFYSDSDVVCTGDHFILRLAGNNIVEIIDDRPGPLNAAVNPDLIGGNSDTYLPMIGQVISKISSGVIVLLKQVITPTGEPIYLRGGITGLFRYRTMRDDDRQTIEYASNYRDIKLNVILIEQPRLLSDGRIRLELYSSEPESVEEIINYVSLGEKLDALARRLKQNPDTLLSGSIVNINRSQNCYVVVLDELEDYPEHVALLPFNKITFNQYKRFYSLGAFNTTRFEFKVIDIDAVTLTISLIDNPILSIAEHSYQIGWSESTRFRDALFVAMSDQTSIIGSVDETYLESDTDTNGDAEELNLSTENSAIIELSLGVIISVPLSHLLYNRKAYRSVSRSQIPQPGDTLDLTLINENNDYFANISRIRVSKIRRLANLNRVFYARIGKTIDGLRTLKLEWGESEGVNCFVDPQVNYTYDELKDIDLFRVSKREGDKLYFTPVVVSELQRRDRLNVTLHDLKGSEDFVRLTVKFGNNHIGHVREDQISYDPEFSLSNYEPEVGREVNASFNFFNKRANVAEFDLRFASEYKFDYIIDRQRSLTDRLLNIVIVRKRKNHFVVEMEPTVLVQIPFDNLQSNEILGLPESSHQWKLEEGDKILVRVLKHKNIVMMHVESIQRSILRYCKEDDLVPVRFSYSTSNKEWFFELKNHSSLTGKLDERPKQVVDVFSRDSHLVISSEPNIREKTIRLRRRRVEDVRKIVRVENISPTRIKVRLENGEAGHINISNATYRIDKILSYLNQEFKLGDILVTTSIKEEDKDILSLKDNPIYPVGYFYEYIGTKAIEVVYIKTEANQHLFEVKPGTIVSVPVYAFQFQEQVIDNMWRFASGDVFEMNVVEISNQIVLMVQKFQLASTNNFEWNQLVELEVIDIFADDRYSAVVVRHDRYEHVLPHWELLNNYSEYHHGQKIWGRIKRIDKQTREIFLAEIERPNFEDLPKWMKKNRNNDKPRPIHITATIIGRETNRVGLDILGHVPKPYDSPAVTWLSLSNSSSLGDLKIKDILLNTQEYLRVQVSKRNKGLGISYRINKHNIDNYAHQWVQARVHNVVMRRGKVKTILLDIDGMITLAKNEDFVIGISDRVPAVTRDQWVRVYINQIQKGSREQETAFRVTAYRNDQPLRNISKNKPAKAKVIYTSEYGLVFEYHGTPGFIPADKLCWNSDETFTPALLYSPRDTIRVYITSNNPILFASSEYSQIRNLRTGEEIEAKIVHQAKHGVYLRFKSTYIFFKTQLYLSDDKYQIGNFITLRVTRVFPQKGIIEFLGKTSKEYDTDANDIRISNADLMQNYDSYYATSVISGTKNLTNIVSKLKRSDPATLEDELLQVLNREVMPNHRNARALISHVVSMNYLTKLEPLLSQYIPREQDSWLVWVLCQLCRYVSDTPLLRAPNEWSYLVAYSFGILALANDESSENVLEFGLSYLYRSMSVAPCLDTMIAIMFVKNRLQLFDLDQFHKIINNINLSPAHLMVTLPDLLSINNRHYSDLQNALLPSINQDFYKVSGQINDIKDSNYDPREKYLQLSNWYTKLKVGNVFVYELNLNLAILAIIQEKYEEALAYVRDVHNQFTRDPRPLFKTHPETALKLEFWIYYLLGDYEKLLRLSIESIEQLDQLDLDTWIAYLLHSQGLVSVSREIVMKSRSTDFLTKLLQVFYRGFDEEPHFLNHLRSVQELYLNDLTVLSRRLQPRFISNLENLAGIGMIRKMVDNVADDLAYYAFLENESFQISNTADASVIIDLTRRLGDIQLGTQIAKDCFEKYPNNESVQLLLKQYIFTGQIGRIVEFSKQNPGVDWKSELKTILGFDVDKDLTLSIDDLQPILIPHYQRFTTHLLNQWLNLPQNDSVSRRFERLLSQSIHLTIGILDDKEVLNYFEKIFVETQDVTIFEPMLDSSTGVERILPILVKHGLRAYAIEAIDRLGIQDEEVYQRLISKTEL